MCYANIPTARVLREIYLLQSTSVRIVTEKSNEGKYFHCYVQTIGTKPIFLH